MKKLFLPNSFNEKDLGRKQIVRVMRLTTSFLLLCSCFTFATNVNSQNSRVNLNQRSVELEQILDDIEQQTDYLFISNREVDLKQQISVRIKNKPIKEVLEKILLNTGLTFEMEGVNIILSKKESLETVSRLEQSTKRVMGIVVDQKGEPIIGANVVEKGTTNGIITDIDGKFTIETAPNASLLISYIGYVSQEVNVGKKSNLNIRMEEDSQSLDEVVVVGYGVVKKSDLTGSVSSVKSGEINAYPTTNVLQSLAGKSSGLQIKQNTGAPGGSMSVRIRGTNSIQGSNEPLYVVDGFPLSDSPNSLNNSEIESVEILKDASATAIYGSRGANGVVLITTKQGKAGKTRVEFDASYSSQRLIKKLEMMDATEYAQFYNLQQKNDTGKEFFTSDQINSFGKGFDWQDLVFRDAPMWKGSLSINGGNEKTRFALSGSVFAQDGIIKGSDYKRYSVLATFNHEINKILSVNFSSTLSRNENNSKNSGGGARGSSMISAAVSAPPTLTPYTENGDYVELATAYPFLATDLINPLNFINEQSSHSKSNNVLANASLVITPIADLTIKLMGGIENKDATIGYYKTRQYLHSSGYAEMTTSNFTSLLNENTVSFNKKVGLNSISALAGFTFQNFLSSNLRGSGTGFLSDKFEEYKLQTASTPGIPSSGYSKSVLMSYLFRVNYGYDEKYLATISMRRDGSSRYSKGNKWGSFPSAALAWRVSNEDFLKENPVVSNMKLRASWGLTGSQAIDAYTTLNILENKNTIFGDALYNTFAPGSRLAGNLKWETTEQFNVGLDVGLWNRLNLTLDYYVKNTRDLLNTVQLPTSSGYVNTIQNIGKVQNRGFELNADVRILTGEFKWDVNANISFNRNEVKKLYGGDDIFAGRVNAVVINDETNILREGYPIGQFWGYVEDGYDSKGQIIFKDLNEDGAINKEDKTFIGDPNPDFIYGITTNMSYKNFELNVFFQGSQGNDLFNASAISNTVDYGFGLNMPKDVFYNHWTPENTNAAYPAISYNTKVRVSDRFIENGSYLRLKNIQLAYNVPLRSINCNWLNSLQVYASGQNLLTFTKYSWWDPEVNSYGSANSVSQGIDFSSYPSSKSFTFGVRVGF